MAENTENYGLAQTGLRPPPPLSVTAEGMDARWKLWAQQFRWYAVATHLDKKAPEIQVATFMNTIGLEAISIYNTFDLTEAQVSDLSVVQSKFEAYFAPKVNETYASWMFLKLAKKETESFDEFMTQARTLVKPCNYGKLQDRMLRDKIVFGVCRDEVREKLLIEPKLTLEKAILLCRSYETATKQMADMKRQTEKSINAIQERKGNNHHQPSTAAGSKASNESNTSTTRTEYPSAEFDCRRCGKRHKQRRCPAFGKNCGKCGRKGHFSKLCKAAAINEVVASDSAEEQYIDELYVSSLRVLCASFPATSDDDWHEPIQFPNGFVLIAKLDSGAQCNAIGMDIVKKAGLQLRPSGVKRLVTFSHSKMPVVGEAECDCIVGKVRTKITFIVVDVPVTPVLGRKACEQLGFLVRVHSTELEPDLPREAFQGLGKLTGFEYNIDFKENPEFTVHPPRRIAISLRSKVRKELDEMVRLGVISRVTVPTPAVSPLVVVQQKDKVRICMDPTDLNRQILRRHFPMKTIEDIVTHLNGARYFTLLDCRKGFWQIPVAENSRKYLTIATPWGRYLFNRVPFGIASAPELFQQIITSLLEDEPNAENSVDDILLFAPTLQEIKALTSRVVHKLSSRGIRFNREKCTFYSEKVKFLGHVITKDGLAIDPSKVEAIQLIRTPTGQKELQRFIGMINYLSKFLPNYSGLTAPLRELLKKDVAWCWDVPQQQAFQRLKTALQKPPVLAYFNPNKSATLSVDASSLAVGAVLLQEGRPVAYATQALTSAQKNYPQIEKEAFAIRFACKRFHEYIYGRDVVIETDHKPLEAISKKPLHSAPLRLQRIMFDIVPYSPRIIYKPGTMIPIPDTLSRDCMTPLQENLAPESDEYEVQLVLPMSTVASDELRTSTARDHTMQMLKKVILDGWPDTIDSVPQAVVPYWNYREELAWYDGILLKGSRPIIPAALHTRYLELIHLGHLGIQSCLRRARDSVFWHGMTSDITSYITACQICQSMHRRTDKAPVLLRRVPETPWQIVASDMFEVEGVHYLLIVDSFTGFYDFVKLTTVTSGAVVAQLKRWFAVFGIPEELQTDNGPQYSASQFVEFVQRWQFNHVTSSPHYPQSNGLAERFVQVAKNLILRCSRDSSDIQLALLNARNTPRPDMGSSAYRMFGRQTRSLLPYVEETMGNRVSEKLLRARQLQKHYADPQRDRTRTYQVGDPVRVREAPRQWTRASVTAIHNTPRSVILTTENGKQLRRNTSVVRHSPVVREAESTPALRPRIATSLEAENVEPSIVTTSPAQGIEVVPSSQGSACTTRSGRLIKPPERLNL